MKRKFSIFIIFIILINELIANDITSPEWINFPYKGYEDGYIISVQENKNKETAILKGVSEIASIFGVSVKSTTVAQNQSVLTDNKDYSSEQSLEQLINMCTESDELYGIIISDSWYDKNNSKWYVRICMDKKKALDLYKEQIRKNEIIIESYLNQVNYDYYSLESIQFLNLALEYCKKNEIYNRRLFILDSTTNSKLKFLVSLLESKMTDIKSKTKIYIDIKGCDDIKNELEKYCISQGYTITNSENTRYYLTGNITTSDKGKNNEMYFSEVSANITMVDKKTNKVVERFNNKSKDGGMTYEQAVSRATKKLLKSLEPKNF